MALNRCAASLSLWLSVGVAWGGTLTASPSSRNFGNVSVSAGAVTSTVVLTNTGTFTEVTSFMLSSGCGEFSVSGVAVPVTFGIGDTATLTVSYNPVDRVADTCTVTPTFGSPSGTGGSFVLTGDGTAPVLMVTPTSLSFPDQRWNGGATTLTVTLENAGEEPFTAAQLIATLTSGTQFAIGTPSGFPVNPGASGTLSITFDPTSAGPKTDTLALRLSNGSPTQPNATVSLTGTGVQSTQTFTPAGTFDVGTALLGASATNNLVIGNSGAASLTLLGTPAMSFTGVNAADFSFTDHGCAGQTCNPAPNVIAAGSSTTFSIRCTPSGVGTRTATLTVTSDDPASPRTLSTTCTGAAPMLSTSPAGALAFGLLQVGQVSATQDLSIRNAAGAAPLSYSITGPAEFPLSCAGGGAACLSGTLAGGGVATVRVAFAPQAAGPRSGTLVIASDDPDSNPYQLSVTGTGGVPVLTAPSSFSFGNVPVAQAGGATSGLTIGNSGTVPLDLSQLTITGAADFSFAFGSCTSGQSCNAALSVAPSASTVITLRCDPSTTGSKTGALVITSDDPASPHSVPLTCAGTATPNGSACVDASECASAFCVDGVCCNSGCTEQCRSCALPSSLGTCAAVTGAPIGSRPACASDGTACGGACDGTSNSCVYPGATTSCRAGSCDGGVAVASASCDGAGACPAVQTQTCTPYVCGATGCLGNCTTELECSSASYCAAGVCAPKLALGERCSTAGQCGSGFCADGVCCNASCGAQCEACDVSGLVGTCSPVASGPPHSGRPACSGLGACMGQCDGTSPSSCAPATGLPEVCNGADDDCDAVVDDGLDCSDAGAPDAGAPDAGAPDAGTPDAGSPDAGSDAGTMSPDGGMMVGEPSGCGCGAGRAEVSLVLVQLALWLRRRRRVTP